MFEIKREHSHLDNEDQYEQQPEPELDKVQILPISSPSNNKIHKIKIKSQPGQDLHQYIGADSLVPELQKSISVLERIIFQAISEKRKDIQSHVFYSIVEDSKEYLMRLLNTGYEKAFYTNDMISKTVDKVNQTIFQEILEGEHNIHKIVRPTKEDIYGGPRSTEITIRLRQEMLKAKLSDLKLDINNSSIHQNSNPSTTINLNSADLFSENSYKSKKAKQFVRRMQELQEEQRREKQLKQELKKQKLYEEELQRREIDERIKREKHEFLRKQFQRKREEKQRERKQQEAKNQQFQNFLKEYKSKIPLHQQKQKEYIQKILIPQTNKKLSILKQIREDRKPLNHLQLKQHEKQYLQIKEDHKYQKNAVRQLSDKQKKIEKVYYKGKFHSIIEKEDQEKLEGIDGNQKKLEMYTKRLEYGNQIKNRFVPKIDIKKKEELEKSIEEQNRIQRERNNRSMDMGYKKDGKDNLQMVRKYINQLKAKGKIRYSSSKTIESSPLPNSSRYKNYLHELRQHNSQMRSSRTHSIDYNTIFKNFDDTERIKLNLKRKQQCVQRKQQYVANLDIRNLQKYLQEKKRLDEDILETVKVKMAIINKFQD